MWFAPGIQRGHGEAARAAHGGMSRDRTYVRQCGQLGVALFKAREAQQTGSWNSSPGTEQIQT